MSGIQTRLEGEAFQNPETVEEAAAELERTIAAGEAAGMLAPEEADSANESGLNAIYSSALEGLINSDPEAAIEAITKGDFDDFLTTTQLNAFQDIAKKLQSQRAKQVERDEKKAKAEAKEQLALARQETGDEFTTAIRDRALTGEMILASNLEPTGENSKNFWFKKIDAQAKEPTRFEIRNEELYADILTRVIIEPENVKEKEITDLMGDGLRPVDVTFLTDRLRKGDSNPKKSDPEKRSYEILKRARNKGLFAGVTSTSELFGDVLVENELQWAKYVQLLDEFIANHPDEDPVAFVEEALKPIRETTRGEWIDDFFGGKTEEAIEEELRQEKEKGLRALIERPPASEHKGRTIEDTETGQLFKSDGKTWVEIK